jgi:hypothetical protein
MTSPVGRIYVTALTLFTFFLTWALVAAHPWPSSVAPAPDPRLRALAAREHKLQRESIATKRLLKRRWANYRAQLAQRNSQIAAARQAPALVPAPPSVRITSQPAVTATSSS